MSEQPDHGDATVPARFTTMPSWLITQTAAYTHRLVGDGFAAVGARGYHYRVLASLEESGPASQAALGRRSAIHLSDIVATINELAEQGLVDRAPDPDDKRRNVITITAAGRQQLRRLDKRLAAVQEDLLAPLDQDERAQLTRLLSRMLDYHRGTGAR
jgi:DNA-binding MarR family transcriptional regulator